jgi:hypothetical protein
MSATALMARDALRCVRQGMCHSASATFTDSCCKTTVGEQPKIICRTRAAYGFADVTRMSPQSEFATF